MLVPIDKLPLGLEVKDKVLAYGEVTGHKHQFTGQATQVMVDTNGRQYASLGSTDTLMHEEHADLQVGPGIYEVRVAREIDLLGAVRQVMD